MSQADIKKLESNQICIVVARDPARVKFFDPIPAVSSRTEIENAAIKLSRLCLNGSWTGSNTLDRKDLTKFFVEFLVKGTPLDPNGTREEVESGVYDNAKWDEIRRLAREDARAEREAKKKALQEPPKE